MLAIRTTRLEVIAVTPAIARADASNRASLPNLLSARVESDWPPELLSDHLEEFAQLLENDSTQVGWSGWYFVVDEGAPDERVLIGSGGFLPPDRDGTVLIGYSLLPKYEGRCYATEAMRAILDWAIANGRVARFAALTFPHLTKSIRVLTKLGFECVGAGNEPDTLRFERQIRTIHAAN